MGNLKIQNNPTAYISADKLVFDSGHTWLETVVVGG
jgi:hypothetical protein